MLEVVKAGGWVMIPLLLCSVLAVTIILERFWSLRAGRVAPHHLFAEMAQWFRVAGWSVDDLERLRQSSALGCIFAAGLTNHAGGRELMKEAMEEAGTQVTHQLERYLNTLGTIAAVSPLLGLLGSVLGMIDELRAMDAVQGPTPSLLAGGLAQALVATAAGLLVAIPSVTFYRFFERRVEELVVQLEQQAIQLVEMAHGERPLLPMDPEG